MRLLLPTRLSAAGAAARLLFTAHPRAFLTSTLGTLIEPLFYPLLLLILHQLLALTISPGTVQVNGAVTACGVALVALLLIQRLAIIARDGSSNILRQLAWVVISTRVMHKLSRVPYTLFENNAFQARYGLVIREAAQRSTTLVDSLLSTIPILLGVLGLAATLLALAPLMVIALFVIAIPALLTERRLSQAMYGLQERSAPQQLRMDVLTNMQVDADFQRDVRIYHSDLVSHEYTRLARRYLAELKRLTARFLGLRAGVALAQMIGLGLALAVAFVLLGRGQLSVAGFAVLIPGISLLSGMINAFLYQYRSLRESLLYAETLFDFLTTSFDPPPQTPADALPPGETTHLAAIEIKHISYTYPETGREALTDISCVFKPGLTAIVGTNGAGKSTLIKLLSGLVTPTSGQLIATLSTGEERSLAACQRAILFQEPAHFPFSIRHNVTMRSEQLPEEGERIWEALRQAGLQELVQALPAGLDTVVGAGFGGVTDLSGGQWQRLALARLLYHDAPLLILDEPSASLDPVGERQIFALLAQLSREKIILFATHRYDTIRQADAIAMLVDGQLAEMGTHEELELHAREFWSLYLAQQPTPAAERPARQPRKAGQ